MSEVGTDERLYQNMIVLCVDDEKIILKTLQRLFRSKSYQLLVANSGSEALQILKKHSVNVIVSDMRMPEMDGSTLLKKVAVDYPGTYRIVLSGYADFESTVDAINLGKVHRFVNKPWDNADLVVAVERGLELVRLTKENAELKQKIEVQNTKLKQINNTLEEKVELRTKQIKTSLLRNERNNKDCERMLFNFIGINPNLCSDFAKHVAHLAVRLGEALGMDKEALHDIRLASHLNELGLLGLDPHYSNTPFRLLSYDEKTKFMEQGEVAKQILSPAQRLYGVKSILSLQFLPLAKIEEKATPQTLQACKVIIISRDFWRFVYGKIEEAKLSPTETFTQLNKSRGTKYDEKILDLLISCPHLVEETVIDGGLKSLQLLPDMVLKHSLFSQQNLLILAEGHVFTESSIEALIEFEFNKKQNFIITIEK